MSKLPKTAINETVKQDVGDGGWSDLYGYDESLAEQGVWIEYPGKLGSFHLAMMGNGSRAFAIKYDALLKPNRRKIELGDDKLGRKLIIQAFVDAVLLDWKNVHDEGKRIAFSKENAHALLTKYPRLLDKLMTEAGELANFRQAGIEAEAKNSVKS